MLLVLSPAKTLDYTSATIAHTPTLPQFLADSAQLAQQLAGFTAEDLAQLMGISMPLATLNCQRFATWRVPYLPDTARAAIFAFAGDVYEGLMASSWSAEDVSAAQNNRLLMLSGLYGVLRPLDAILPYRLEMGTPLPNVRGKNLYDFWGDRLRTHVEQLIADTADGEDPVLVNLASQEYFKVLQPAKLRCPVVEIVFEEWRATKYKIISFSAKRARGLMARAIIQNQYRRVNDLKEFNDESYAFNQQVSTASRLVFRRPQQ